MLPEQRVYFSVMNTVNHGTDHVFFTSVPGRVNGTAHPLANANTLKAHIFAHNFIPGFNISCLRFPDSFIRKI